VDQSPRAPRIAQVSVGKRLLGPRPDSRKGIQVIARRALLL
jgi:hypothetical protein